ncbi:PIN domain-containing protein [Desulfocastanea catecholica]
MSVLIDSSVWIEYFRNGNNSEKVDFLIDENLVVTNDLILAELTPFLKIRKQHNLVDLLNNISRLPIDIKWDQIIDFQYLCLQNGLNGVGIPDLIIVQNAIQNISQIYSLDKHFSIMNGFLGVSLGINLGT